MKNLSVHSQNLRDLKELRRKCGVDNFLPEKCICCVNSDNDDLYIFTENELHVISTEENDLKSIPIPAGNGKIVAAEFCSISQQIYCAYDTGALAVFEVENNFTCDVVATINEGIRCMKLSPDHEMLILITKEENVMTMTSNFITISEENLCSDHFGEKQFITVGWGKKETQFHGSEGKAAAKVVQTLVKRCENDDGLPRITWIGSGALFAVSFLDRSNDARRFKVFNREGILQYTSELISGLEENLSWKPSGNLIAVSQKLPNKHVIALFEKNGLKHREFALNFRDDAIKIKDVSWSADSEILSILYEDEKKKGSYIQLWTEKNYHWYLKQTMRFPKQVLHVIWSSTRKCGKILTVITTEEWTAYTFRWTINHSLGKELTDKSTVAVIDGAKVLLTGFRDCIVPPPMAQHVLDTGEEINAIAFAPGNTTDSNSFVCFLHDNSVLFYKYDADSLQYLREKNLNVSWEEPAVQQKSIPNSAHHFLWFKENTILFSISTKEDGFCCIILCAMYIDTENASVTVRDTHFVDGCIEHIVPSPDPKAAYIVTDAAILKYSADSCDLEPVDVERQEQYCQVEVVDIEDSHVFVSRTNSHRLYINEKEVANNVTSFHVHSEFLILTTLQHTLICFPLNKAGLEQLVNSDLTIKPWEDGSTEKSLNGLNIRRVERGSTLVTVVAKSARTILQMPRGNLECIQPRALSLFIIASSIDNLNYCQVFDLMRKQRINLNLIVDHNPRDFMENARKFVEDVKNPNWLSLFLTELNNEDVTRSTYSSCYPNRKNETAFELDNKVETVCEIMREIMEKRADSERYIQPILTSLVKRKQSTGLEDALRKIKEIQAKQEGQFISAEEALKYLLYLVDVNVLLEVALGMYDFELAMFVAQKSQKDPKEYVPFLNAFKKLEDNYMKYSIDKHLGRYEKALEHISKIPERFDECMSLVKTQNLYMKALKVFQKKSKKYKDIAKAYGEFLLEKAQYQEAGVMFAKSEAFADARNAYKLAGSWQEAIVMAQFEKLDPSDFQQLYRDLVSRLEDDKRYKEAASILSKFLSQPEDSVAVLCKGKIWQDAWREAHCMRRDDLIETHVKPGVNGHAQYLLLQVKKNGEDFEKHKSRLALIRSGAYVEEMRAKNQMVFDYDLTTDKGRSDMLSDTTSVTGTTITRSSQISRTTGRSYRSSKNRRKQERKLLSVKEGSLFEDVAIIRTLYEIVSVSYAQKDEAYAVAQMLLLFNRDELAEELCLALNKLLKDIENGKFEIWRKRTDVSIEEEPASEKKQFLCGNLPPGLIEPHILNPPENKSQKRNFDGLLNIFKRE